ncbi:MAG TPA: hypothetical protein VIA07_04275 [Desulfuromonadales bacterium]|jgi:hypothetical protein
MAEGRNRTSLRLGLEDWSAAALFADNCATFIPDVEEEQIADDPRSCYNCRYRRWQADSVVCLAG